MKTKRIYYLDFLRIIATFAIIIIHVSSQRPYYSQPVHSFTWQSLNFWSSIMRWGVPIFVMISGVLFLDPKRPISTKKLFTKNIWRIVCATIFWHFFYACYTFLFENHSYATLIRLLIKGYSHLWFLHMIIGLYLLVPLLRKITENTKLTQYFLLLAAIFAVILPTFFSIYKSLLRFHTFSPAARVIINSLSTLFSSMYVKFVLGFTGYFVAGYYFSQAKLSKNWIRCIYIMGILGLFITFFGTNSLSLHFNARVLPLYDYMSINVAATAIAIFVFIKNCGQKSNAHFHNKRNETWLTALSNLTFGIYLVHFLFIRILTKSLHVGTLNSNAPLAVPVITVVVFLASLIVSLIIKKVSWLNSHIM
ncbi:acyltransferase family protein [Lactobacillus sp. ESL0791]|uniref:acyltransferase n=1 Tax=Lactobacillus sp. ESL0791 TaxID=2983234 RepID=UPI0023F6A5EB|nr:acyltransferase family protein [Lactobacillus sp. ESL0791]MDF7639846.1 acyltransferase family protein [Lactobacillus sp. ESL0791]